MSRIEEALSKAIRHTPPGASANDIPPPLPEPREAKILVPANHMLLTITSPNSGAAEEYRKLKEALIKESKREGFSNVVLVTSVNPQEGKSVTTLNLAISLAQEFDYTVLVVDADLRAPSCHRYLGIEPETGLSDCLSGKATCSEALIRTGIGRLVLLPAGPAVANPVELISSSKMRQLVQELKHRYPDRFILIDSPPAKMFAETRFLASMADGALVVVREGESSLEDLTDISQALHDKIIGFVYNYSRENPFQKNSQYYYGYSHANEAEE